MLKKKKMKLNYLNSVKEVEISINNIICIYIHINGLLIR